MPIYQENELLFMKEIITCYRCKNNQLAKSITNALKLEDDDEKIELHKLDEMFENISFDHNNIFEKADLEQYFNDFFNNVIID